MIGMGTLGSLPLLRDYRSKRSSSFDKEGHNDDYFIFKPGDKRDLLLTSKPGCVKHVWMTVGGGGPNFLRKLVIRAWWDGETDPSIECPLGDFFGLGHGAHKNFISLPLQFSPQDGRGMNCWWPMPFNAARIELHSECDENAHVYFYVDYEEYPRPHKEDVGRFHATWNRENPTEGWLDVKLTGENIKEIWSKKPNLDGADNYVILDAEGEGVYVGCNLSIDCYHRQGNAWYGEGDDMIFIDGEKWPPSLHGTGTEDYFNMAFCPQTEYCAPYHGLTMYSGNSEWPWKGKNAMYRYHIEDPIRFRESIRVSIEHGHANKLWNDYSSCAYWYQKEPHKPFKPLLPVADRLPRPNEPEFSHGDPGK